MASLNKASLALVATIAAAMAVPPHYALATEAQAKQLTENGFAEFNPEITDDGKIAIRLTDAGLALPEAKTDTATTTQTTTPAATQSTGFDIISNATLPGMSRGGRNGPAYPFDNLEVGQSFFVPATADKPDPASSIASTATSASKRYAREVMNPATPQTNEDGSPVVGDDGNPVMNPATPVMEEYKVKGEVKTRPKLEFDRKFAVKSVEEGKTYGEWTAPANGALVQRTK